MKSLRKTGISTRSRTAVKYSIFPPKYSKSVNTEIAVAPFLEYPSPTSSGFTLTEYQIVEAKAIGADVVLLIAASLGPKRLEELAKFAQSLGLEVLMEVHNLEELERSINPYLNVVGVNNRNLKTMEVSVQTSLDLVERIPNEFVRISESGLSTASTLKELKEVGYQGFLMGESFMKTENPSLALGDLIAELKR
jgi:indole-3-glycerol phosphate synthase